MMAEQTTTPRDEDNRPLGAPDLGRHPGHTLCVSPLRLMPAFALEPQRTGAAAAVGQTDGADTGLPHRSAARAHNARCSESWKSENHPTLFFIDSDRSRTQRQPSAMPPATWGMTERSLEVGLRRDRAESQPAPCAPPDSGDEYVCELANPAYQPQTA